MAKKNKKSIIVFIYNSFKDPLYQGLLFKYLTILNKDSHHYEFHIVTFEQEAYKMTANEISETHLSLRDKNFFWYPQTFHTGRFILIKKTIDLFQAFIEIVKIQLKYKPQTILSFANIAGSFSYVLSKLFRWKTVVFSYEPHSEFMNQLGYWNDSSVKYKLLNTLENKMGLHGDYIITGTKYMIKRLSDRGATSKFYRLPTCVDSSLFTFSLEKRNAVRAKLGIENRKVIIYTGKFGDLYYKEEIYQLAQALYEKDPAFFFVFLTGHDKKELESLFKEYNIPHSAYFVGRVPFEQVNDYLSAGDMGLVTVADFPSKKYCSPTKVGEYLCCGLPYIVSKGTSEDDLYARDFNVGVVVDDFEKTSVINQYSKIDALLTESKDVLVERCRRVGIEYRGIDNAIKTLKEVFDDIYT